MRSNVNNEFDRIKDIKAACSYNSEMVDMSKELKDCLLDKIIKDNNLDKGIKKTYYKFLDNKDITCFTEDRVCLLIIQEGFKKLNDILEPEMPRDKVFSLFYSICYNNKLFLLLELFEVIYDIGFREYIAEMSQLIYTYRRLADNEPRNAVEYISTFTENLYVDGLKVGVMTNEEPNFENLKKKVTLDIQNHLINYILHDGNKNRYKKIYTAITYLTKEGSSNVKGSI